MKRPMNGHKISKLFFGPPGDTELNERNDHEDNYKDLRNFATIAKTVKG